MTPPLDRRSFLGAAAGAALALPRLSAAGANDRLTVAVMGCGGRGTSLAQTFSKNANVRVTHVCDPDSARTAKAAAAVEKAGGPAPKPVADYQALLDDKTIDILVCAAPNHWHAPATILACAAGKHVYVEKPCSHTPREGERMVAAARRHKRVVQMGNQRRSMPRLIEAVKLVRDGAIGRAYYAQCFYTNLRESIGRGTPGDAPQGLDYELWQGPAPRKAFKSNYLHYNWHWFWHWGNGELGNNGVHFVDVCRWGLGVDYPTRVTSAGGRYAHEDDQETPDTQTVSFEFDGRKSIRWEGLSCTRPPEARAADVIFMGDKGTLSISGGGFTVYDPQGKQVRNEKGAAGDADHVANFLAAVRETAEPHSEIEQGHKSTLLCHLGNIAQRSGRVLRTDPRDGRILDDSQSAALWDKEYAPGWAERLRDAAGV